MNTMKSMMKRGFFSILLGLAIMPAMAAASAPANPVELALLVASDPIATETVDPLMPPLLSHAGWLAIQATQGPTPPGAVIVQTPVERADAATNVGYSRTTGATITLT